MPFVQPGHSQIYDQKLQAVAGGTLFPADAEIRLVIFGNSRVMAGFIPDVFDTLSTGRVSSYNLGLPNSGRFVEEIEQLVDRGEVPTHVFLTRPWLEKEAMTVWRYLGEDDLVMKDLFPFREFPRDLAQFAIRSLARGGLRGMYNTNLGYLESARRDRGYFFIEAQSHFAGHRLPDDFQVESETPEKSWVRECALSGPTFERLLNVTKGAGIQVFMVPEPLRENQYAPAPSNDVVRESLASFGIEVLGPDYWLYPNRLFSDPTHLNPGGADVHTRRLWDLTGEALLDAAAARPSEH